MNPICDTNILSELARKEPNSGVLAWASRIQRIDISAITVEEIFFGLTLKPKPKIRSWFTTFLEERCGVLPVCSTVAQQAAILRGELAHQGACRTQADMLIAATALVHGRTLITRNTRDFEGCRIALLNPFI